MHFLHARSNRILPNVSLLLYSRSEVRGRSITSSQSGQMLSKSMLIGGVSRVRALSYWGGRASAARRRYFQRRFTVVFAPLSGRQWGAFNHLDLHDHDVFSCHPVLLFSPIRQEGLSYVSSIILPGLPISPGLCSDPGKQPACVLQQQVRSGEVSETTQHPRIVWVPSADCPACLLDGVILFVSGSTLWSRVVTVLQTGHQVALQAYTSLPSGKRVIYMVVDHIIGCYLQN